MFVANVLIVGIQNISVWYCAALPEENFTLRILLK